MKCFVLLAILGLTLSLGGCETDGSGPPITQVTGPTFAQSAFVCPPRPMPPDPAGLAGKPAGRLAEIYENKLDKRGQVCAAQLGNLGTRLQSAGQVR